MLKKVVVTLGLLIGLTGCSNLGDPVYTEETYTLDATEEILIDLSAMEVEIISYDGEDLRLNFEGYEFGSEIAVREGRRLRIKEVSDLPITFNLSINQSPKLFLEVPEDYHGPISLENSSGDIYISNLVLDSLSIDISSGDTELSGLSFDQLEIETSSGDVILEELVGEKIDLHTSSGDVDAYNVNAPIDGRLSSGNVTMTLPGLNQDIDFNISSGSFDLTYSEDHPEGEYDLKVSSGDIDMAYDLDRISENDDDEVKGTIGDGNNELTVRISSGDIEIH